MEYSNPSLALKSHQMPISGKSKFIPSAPLQALPYSWPHFWSITHFYLVDVTFANPEQSDHIRTALVAPVRALLSLYIDYIDYIQSIYRLSKDSFFSFLMENHQMPLFTNLLNSPNNSILQTQ